jgi:hypothetical protein
MLHYIGLSNPAMAGALNLIKVRARRPINAANLTPQPQTSSDLIGPQTSWLFALQSPVGKPA